MELKNHITTKQEYSIYKEGNMAIRVYNDAKLKEKCLYAALTHARVETTLVNSFVNIPTLHEVSVIDGKWSITTDWVEGKTLGQLMKENPDKLETYINQFIDIQTELHAQYMPLLSKLKDKM